MSAAPPTDLTPAQSPTDAATKLPGIRQEESTHNRGFSKGYRLLAVSVAAFLIFGVMAFLVRGLAPLSVDVDITHAVQSISLSPVVLGYHIPIYDETMEAISFPGFAPYNIISAGIIVAIFLLLRRFAEALTVAVALLGVEALVEAVKVLVARPRPTADFVQVQDIIGGYSFPSGHVAGYVCLFGCLFYFAWTLMKPNWLRALILIGSGLMVALVGVSRIYLGQHWASDVLGGYGLGFGWLGLCIWGYRQWELRHLARLQGLQAQAQDAIMGASPAASGAAGPPTHS